MTTLKTLLCGLTLKNPIITGSGCFGFGLEYCAYFDPNQLGAIVLKGLTLEPRDGNLGTRIAETSSGMLNSVGLENPGIDYFEQNIVPELTQALTIPVIANINGQTLQDYVALAERINEISLIQAVELNISCPNVKEGGMAFGANPRIAEQVTQEVRNVLNKPLIVKLSPNVTDIVDIAQRVAGKGADALSLINTLLGMAIDVQQRKPILGNIFGGLSGPAIMPIALRMVYQIAHVVSLPIIGMGGINHVQDALAFIMAGASVISIGTGFFQNPLLSLEIEQGLIAYCAEHGIHSIAELVGIAHFDHGVAYRQRLLL